MDFSDPQEIFPILEVLPQDLVDAFGEENIHFGPTPPNMNDISFQVDGLNYVTSIRYLFGPSDDDEYILSTAAPPTYDATQYYHHFKNAIGNMAQHKLKTIDPSHNIFTRDNDTIYLIGQGSSFTAYYTETIQEEASGNPTNYIIISGTLVTDEKGFVGVKDYRIGKKIKKYERRPVTPSYAPGTIEVKTHEGLSPQVSWDRNL